jgi:curved DNA-binding protein CbpA
MSLINLYDILNVTPNCTTDEIKNAYKKTFVVGFYSHRPGGGNEIFELITHAYKILVNVDLRKKYDKKYALSTQVKTDIFDLKSKYKDYYETVNKELDDIKSINEKIFDEYGFDLAKFHVAFDAIHKKIPETKLDSNLNSTNNYKDFIINITI